MKNQSQRYDIKRPLGVNMDTNIPNIKFVSPHHNDRYMY